MYQLSNAQFTARLSADVQQAVNTCLQQLQTKRGIVFSSQSEALQALVTDWTQLHTAENNGIQPAAAPENAIELADNEYIVRMDSVMETRLEAVRTIARLPKPAPFDDVLSFALLTAIDAGNLVAYDAPALDALDGFAGTDPTFSGLTPNALVVHATRQAIEAPKEVEKPLHPHDVVIHLSPAQHEVLNTINANRIVEQNKWNARHEKQLNIETPADTMRNSFFNKAQLYNWSGNFYTGFDDDEPDTE